MKLTIETLDKAWIDYHTDKTDGIFQDQRFGQYFFNRYDLEVGNSFYIEDNDLVYELLFNHIIGEEV
mgnify:FL=1